MGELKNAFYINQLQDAQPLFGLIAFQAYNGSNVFMLNRLNLAPFWSAPNLCLTLKCQIR